MGAWGNSIQHTPCKPSFSRSDISNYIHYIYIELATSSIFISFSLSLIFNVFLKVFLDN